TRRGPEAGMTALFASGTAEFSACEVYRYWLTRELNGEVRDREGDRVLVSCGLNPSVADAEKNDPTIRKDIGFAMRWGCGKLVKVNGYGYRSTDPNAMKRAGKSGIDIVGPDNDHWIGAAVRLVMLTDGIFMCNWGNHIEPARQRKISEIIEF